MYRCTFALRWTYRPPSTYKILLYFPERDSFLISPIYEWYAFDSSYTIDLSDPSAPLLAKQNYDFTWEIISLIVRIVLTILLELAIALLFGYREKRLFAWIVGINIITQVILNDRSVSAMEMNSSEAKHRKSHCAPGKKHL